MCARRYLAFFLLRKSDQTIRDNVILPGIANRELEVSGNLFRIAEDAATFTNRANSTSPPRAQPSAMFAGIDAPARRNWLVIRISHHKENYASVGKSPR